MATPFESPAPRRSRARARLLAASLLANFGFAGVEASRWFNSESGRLGQLTKDIEI